MTIQSIIRWFEIAKPNPSERDVTTHIGCHFEEVAEMLTATNDNLVNHVMNIMQKNGECYDPSPTVQRPWTN